MKNRSKTPDDLKALQQKLAGLGESSVRKTYYPELQQRLEELERFKAFIDHSNDAIFLFEVPTGRIVDVNDAASRQTGWSRDELLASSLFDVSDLGRSSVAEAPIAAGLEQSGDRALTVAQLRKKQGGGFRAELTLNRLDFRDRSYVLAVARDVTDRLKAEEALRQNENFLNNVVENIPAVVFVKDAQDLRYVAFNKAGEDVLGYSREEMLGKNDGDFFPPEQAEFFMQKDRLTLERGELVEIPEETVKTKSGSDRILHTKKIPLFDVQGKSRYLLGIAEDVTDKKHLEEQLLQSQKMEAIGQLAGGVAHDFNNILMVIMGYADMLKRDAGLEPRQHEAVEQILRASDRAAQLTASLLAFGRKQVIKPRIVNLNDVIQQVQKFLVRIIGEDVELKTIPHEANLPADVDGGQIEQVLINLATNARDAMPKGGQLTIETSQQEVDELFVEANRLGSPGRYAVISVSDTGVGMDEKTRSKIFEPFFTTKELGKGTGLGMSIVYGIVKQHGGFVNVYSEQGLGTTFRIYLPLADQQRLTGSGGADASPPRGGTEAILVAEDEAALRQLLESILTGYGYRVILAENGRDAVEKFKLQPAGRLKLVLMDMIMPVMSGKEACDAIRELDPQVKVIYTSGYTMDVIKTRDDLDDDTELVMKPVQPLELLRKVREMLDR